MDTLLPLVVLILVAIGLVYYVLVPFVSEKVAAVGEDAATRATALELHKVNLYKQIREVEFEREMGLIDEEDFDRTRADLLTEVAQVMRQLEGAHEDRVAPEGPSGPSGGRTSRRTPEGSPSGTGPAPAAAEELVCPGCGILLVPGARFCSSCGTAVAPPTAGCPGCGAPVQSGDRFCASCGRGLLN